VSPDFTEHSGKPRRRLMHNYNQILDLENEQQSEIATFTSRPAEMDALSFPPITRTVDESAV